MFEISNQRTWHSSQTTMTAKMIQYAMEIERSLCPFPPILTDQQTGYSAVATIIRQQNNHKNANVTQMMSVYSGRYGLFACKILA